MKRLLINDLPYDVPAAVFAGFKSLGSEVDRLGDAIQDAPHAPFCGWEANRFGGCVIKPVKCTCWKADVL